MCLLYIHFRSSSQLKTVAGYNPSANLYCKKPFRAPEKYKT